jgi:hypothetical protein
MDLTEVRGLCLRSCFFLAKTQSACGARKGRKTSLACFRTGAFGATENTEAPPRVRALPVHNSDFFKFLK